VLRHGRENVSPDPECMNTDLRRVAEKVGGTTRTQKIIQTL